MNKLDKSLMHRLPSAGRPMKLRAPSLFFAVALAALSAQAQNPGATIESVASDLAALAARVAKLEGQIVATDLVGTYALRGFQIELSGGAGRPAQVSSYVVLQEGTAGVRNLDLNTVISFGGKGVTQTRLVSG
jgi:hypothetical protein